MKVISGSSTYKSITFRTDTHSVCVTANKCKRKVEIRDHSKSSICRFFKNCNKFIRYVGDILYITLTGMLEIFMLYKFQNIMFALYSITLVKGIFNFLVNILNIDFSKKLKKNHAAEHMVFNGCRQLGRVPNKNEVDRYSKYSIHCGVNLMVLQCIFCSILLITKINFPVYLICNILRIIRVSAIFTPVQFLFLSKPDECNINLAVFAIRRLEEIEFDSHFKANEEYIVNSSNKIILKKSEYTSNSYKIMDNVSNEEVYEVLQEYFDNFFEDIKILVGLEYIELNKDNYTNFKNLVNQNI